MLEFFKQKQIEHRQGKQERKTKVVKYLGFPIKVSIEQMTFVEQRIKMSNSQTIMHHVMHQMPNANIWAVGNTKVSQ